jgi:hypothetical protein
MWYFISQPSAVCGEKEKKKKNKETRVLLEPLVLQMYVSTLP